MSIIVDIGTLLLGLSGACASAIYAWHTIDCINDRKRFQRWDEVYQLIPEAVRRANETHPNCGEDLHVVYALDSLTLMYPSYYRDLSDVEKIRIKTLLRNRVQLDRRNAAKTNKLS